MGINAFHETALEETREKDSRMVTWRVGPSGGVGGEEFCDYVGDQDCQVVEVHVYAQQNVNGIQIVHETCDGCEHVLPLHGSADGDCVILKLDADEFITSIRGQYSTHVASICIETSKQISPQLGETEGDGTYRYEAPSGTEIVGFCGRSGESLDAIGVVMRRRGI